MEIDFETEGQISKNKTLLPGADFRINFKMPASNDGRTSLHILSVDKRVQLLGKNHRDHDITREKFLEKSMQLIDGYSVKFNSELSHSVDSRYDDLVDYNTFFITNAYVKDSEITCGVVFDSRFLEEDDYSDNNSDDTLLTTSASERPNFIRTHFPETFIFEDINAEKIQGNQYSLSTHAPHSISTFLVNAFTFHPEHGLEIAEEGTLKVVQNFFIKLFLPYSIHVGETLKVNVAVFNYIKDSSEAHATVKFEKVTGGPARYEFVQLVAESKTCKVEKIDSRFKTKNVVIPEGTGVSSFFFIRATETGKLKIQIVAEAAGFKDVVEKELLVEHAGLSETKTSAYLVDLRDKNHDSHTFECRIGSSYFKDSLQVSATVYGNLLGQALLNAEGLIQMPTGM